MTDRPLRILWTANIDLPAVAPDLGLAPTPFGGWLSLVTQALAARPDFAIGVAMRSESRRFRRLERGGISYFALPQQRNRFDVAQPDVERALSEFAPDILHVEGAEMRHALRFLTTWRGPRLLSIQGVLNGIAPYELGRLPIHSMLNPLRPRIMLTALALLARWHWQFRPRLAQERQAMRAATHVMGRTLWDRAQAAALAPGARYHHAPRPLRQAFHGPRWTAEGAEPHSVFIGSGASPLKGAHIAVRALALLVRDYPGVRLHIAGQDPHGLPWRSAKRHFGYPVYLLDLIRRLGLGDCVCFTGVLSASEMAKRMARSHVYLLSSLIENSPNTLAEAMLLGVPSVSAYAGGAPSMARDEVEALFYRPEDPAMLALQIRRIFEDPALAGRLSQAARARAQHTHDPSRGLADLIAAYRVIMAETGAAAP